MRDYRKEIRKPLNTGSLLLSEPFLKDEEFMRTVSLLCFHDKQEGSMGFILNRPLPLQLNEVLNIDHKPHKPFSRDIEDEIRDLSDMADIQFTPDFDPEDKK